MVFRKHEIPIITKRSINQEKLIMYVFQKEEFQLVQYCSLAIRPSLGLYVSEWEFPTLG